MGRGTKSTRTNQGGLVEVGAGLFDMMASTARGVARGTLGLPGDVEALYDMGRSAVTGEPQRKNVVWNTEDWDKILPAATPLSKLTGEDAVNPYDEIGTFGSVPVYGATARGMMKGGAKVFDKVTGGKTSLSRRDFMKKGGAVAGAAVIGGGMAKVLGDLSKAPVNVPAKAAIKHKFNSLAEYNKYLEDEVKDLKLGEYLPDENFDDWARNNVKKEIAKADEETYTQVKQFKRKQDSGKKLTVKEQEYLDEMGGVLDEFSPQAKAEMKAFKEQADSINAERAASGTMDFDEAYDLNWTDHLRGLDTRSWKEDAVLAGVGGIMAGPKGFAKLSDVLKGTAKPFESKYFGSRYEINPPQELLNKFKSGEIDKRIASIVDAKEKTYKEFQQLLDQVPKEAYNKDFSIDFSKVEPELAKKIQAADKVPNTAKVSEVLDPKEFPALYEAYPDLFDMPFTLVTNPNTKSAASYLATGKTGSITMNKAHMKEKSLSNAEALFHELQHGVQHRELMAAHPDKSFSRVYEMEKKDLARRGSKNPKDISWEAEAYDSGLRDAYPELRDMPIETLKPTNTR